MLRSQSVAAGWAWTNKDPTLACSSSCATELNLTHFNDVTVDWFFLSSGEPLCFRCSGRAELSEGFSAWCPTWRLRYTYSSDGEPVLRKHWGSRRERYSFRGRSGDSSAVDQETKLSMYESVSARYHFIAKDSIMLNTTADAEGRLNKNPKDRRSSDCCTPSTNEEDDNQKAACPGIAPN